VECNAAKIEIVFDRVFPDIAVHTTLLVLLTPFFLCSFLVLQKYYSESDICNS
jgi:hypothetical protein